MARSKKGVVVVAGVIVLSVGVILVSSSWDRILEGWYLSQLDSERAINALIELIEATPTETGVVQHFHGLVRFGRGPRDTGGMQIADGEVQLRQILLTPLADCLRRLGASRGETAARA